MDSIATESSTFTITVRGEQLDLLPERAVYWKKRKALIVADLHFGKAATFRKHGIPVPEGDTQNDLDRLTSVVRSTGAHQLIIAGDLMHAASSKSPEILEVVRTWRQHHADLNIMLVTGNHDRAAGPVPAEWSVEELGHTVEFPPFAVVHDPSHVQEDADYFHFCGHLHPAVSLTDGRAGSLKAACFWKTRNSMVLPGFGKFTGSKAVRPDASDEVFAVTENSVIRIPQALLTKR